jgi:hypothetical protein
LFSRTGFAVEQTAPLRGGEVSFMVVVVVMTCYHEWGGGLPKDKNSLRFYRLSSLLPLFILCYLYIYLCVLFVFGIIFKKINN